MKKVTVYSKPTCPYCKKALLVLNRQGVNPTIIDIAKQPLQRNEMIKKAKGGTTVPQIFFDNEHIGGCDDLVKLEKAGQLEEKLR